MGIAAALSMDNLGVSVGMGLNGAWSRTGRMRQALIFGLFEAGMPLLGLLLGKGIAGPIGPYTGPIAGILLAALGIYALVGPDSGPKAGIFLPALLVSIDNLAVGLALGLHHVSIAHAIPLFAIASVGTAYAGLTFGRFIGSKTDHAGKIGGVALVLVGALIGLGVMA